MHKNTPKISGTPKALNPKMFFWLYSWQALSPFMGYGGALVESMPFDRKVVGSNPTVADTYGPWTSPSLAIARWCFGVKLSNSIRAVLGAPLSSSRLKMRYRNKQNE